MLALVVPLFNIQYCQSKMDGINNSVNSWSIFGMISAQVPTLLCML